MGLSEKLFLPEDNANLAPEISNIEYFYNKNP